MTPEQYVESINRDLLKAETACVNSQANTDSILVAAIRAAVAEERETILIMGKTLRDDHCDSREQAKGIDGFLQCIRARSV